MKVNIDGFLVNECGNCGTAPTFRNTHAGTVMLACDTCNAKTEWFESPEIRNDNGTYSDDIRAAMKKAAGAWNEITDIKTIFKTTIEVNGPAAIVTTIEAAQKKDRTAGLTPEETAHVLALAWRTIHYMRQIQVAQDVGREHLRWHEVTKETR